MAQEAPEAAQTKRIGRAGRAQSNMVDGLYGRSTGRSLRTLNVFDDVNREGFGIEVDF